MARVLLLLICVVLALRSCAVTCAVTYVPSSYAPPGAFPTSLYNSYYNNPTATSAQPQPVISDPVLVRIYYSFCEAFNSLMYIYSTKYIRPDSPTRITYPRYKVPFSISIYTAPSSSFSRRLTPRIPTLSHPVLPTKLFCKTPRVKSNGCLLTPSLRTTVARSVPLPFRLPNPSRSLRPSKPPLSSFSYVSSSSSPAVATTHMALRRLALYLRR